MKGGVRNSIIPRDEDRIAEIIAPCPIAGDELGFFLPFATSAFEYVDSPARPVFRVRIYNEIVAG